MKAETQAHTHNTRARTHKGFMFSIIAPIWIWCGQHHFDASPTVLGVSICCMVLLMRPFLTAMQARGHGLEPHFGPCTTSNITFWRCKLARQPHFSFKPLRDGPKSGSVAFIFDLSMRYNQLPMDCTAWEARNAGASLHLATCSFNHLLQLPAHLHTRPCATTLPC